jgi:hypothetical protein
MSKQITLDDDVYLNLVEKAIELKMILCSANDVIKVLLSGNEIGANRNNENYPSSKLPQVQTLLDGLRDLIFKISPNGMIYHPKHKKWVANPNIVTIIVQDARSRTLRITIYGRPHEFEEILKDNNSELEIKNDMAGYSRFTINKESQLYYAIPVIQHSYNLKKERGRI